MKSGIADHMWMEQDRSKTLLDKDRIIDEKKVLENNMAEKIST